MSSFKKNILAKPDVYTRILSSADFDAYKKLRLAALSSQDNRFFVTTDPPELLRVDDEWRRVCEKVLDKDGRGISVAFGAFWKSDNIYTLIGSALAERWKNEEGETVYYRAIYVSPSFREFGIAERIELLQDAWARKHGYNKSILTIRADKERWVQRQIDRFGAEIVDTCYLKYVNGDTALTHYLKRDIPVKPKVSFAFGIDACDITIRPLSEKDASAYQDILTLALTGEDSRFFTANPHQELSRTHEEWRELCKQTCTKTIIGAFRKNRLIGVMSASQKEGEKGSAYYSKAYIMPIYRNTDVAQRMAVARDDWACEHGFTHACFTIRTDNPWLNVQIGMGAHVTRTYIADFADGSRAPIHLLERPLRHSSLSQMIERVAIPA